MNRVAMAGPQPWVERTPKACAQPTVTQQQPIEPRGGGRIPVVGATHMNRVAMAVPQAGRRRKAWLWGCRPYDKYQSSNSRRGFEGYLQVKFVITERYQSSNSRRGVEASSGFSVTGAGGRYQSSNSRRRGEVDWHVTEKINWQYQSSNSRRRFKKPQRGFRPQGVIIRSRW